MYAASTISNNAFQESKNYFDDKEKIVEISIIHTVVADIGVFGKENEMTALNFFDKPGIIVDTSTVVKKNRRNKFVIGKSGLKLKIPSKWKNPSDEWHIGSKLFKDLLNMMEIHGYDVVSNKEFALLKDKIIDCIVWFDGEKWRACIDTSLSTSASNLENIKVLTNFDNEFVFTHSVNNPNLYFVKISDNGNTLQVLLSRMRNSFAHASMTDKVNLADFPASYVPKEGTQQSQFLNKYPKYDGRGIVMAIIDNAIVDTSLPGMQKTTIGFPKIIDCFGQPDVTVNTSTVVKSQKNFILGLSGRKLQIPSKWKNPSDEWHIGSKLFKDLLNMMEIHGYDVVSNKEFALLKDKIIDCIVWFDGEKWRACIDTSLSTSASNLENIKVLTNCDNEFVFTHCHVKILNNGNLLQMLYPHHDHASKVTHVAAAYFPDNSEDNGLAPGAQIFSMYRGNSEDTLHEMLLKCVELKVDIVNISTGLPLTQKIVEIITKMVQEHGIVITNAAGNDGPFYLSVPQRDYWKISEQLFTIGSVITEEMKTKLFRNFTMCVNNFSSKGPLLSGARGIDFVAPGSAITAFPKWCHRKNEWCTGTSFAAPNAAGSIACLLSALKSNGIPYSPQMIKFALSNTAFLPKGADKLAFGNGIIQIDNAFEFIKKLENKIPRHFLLPFLSNQLQSSGIIHIQNANNQNSSNNYCCYLKGDHKVNSKWVLKCTQNNGNFISHCETVVNQCFNIKIDNDLLEEGSIKYAEIQGIDSSNISVGPLFCLPVTVICPTDAQSFIEKVISLKSGSPSHFFFTMSPGSVKCLVEIVSLDEPTERKIIFGYRCKKFNSWRMNGCETNKSFKTATHENVKILSNNNQENDILIELFFHHEYSNALNIKLKLHMH